MALSQAHRVTLFSNLSPVVGDDEALNAMLSHFPVGEGDEPATKDFVWATAAELRTEIADVRTTVIREIGLARADQHEGFDRAATGAATLADEVRTGLAHAATETANLRDELRTGLAHAATETANLRDELHIGLAHAATETAGLRDEMHTEFGNVRAQLEGVRTEMYRLATVQLRWFIGTQLTGFAVVTGMIALVR